MREDLGSIPEASYLGVGSVVVLHRQANAGVDLTSPQLGSPEYQMTWWRGIEDGLGS